MQERQKGDGSQKDNGNFPEVCCGARKHTEDQADEKSGCSERPSWQPRESDCLPSVFLAAFLTLVFVSVSMVLLCHETVRFPAASRPNTVHLPKGDFQSLPLFFPNQLESTWRTIQRYVCKPSGKSHLQKPWILVGAGSGDTSWTLLCFTKRMLSLLTRQASIGVEFLESTSRWLPPMMGPSENRTWWISSVKVLWVGKGAPGGLVVSLQNPPGGKGEVSNNAFALLGNGGEQIQERFLLQRLSPSLISRILSLSSDRRPEEMMIDHEDFLVLFVTPEQYLESGLVC